VKEFIGGLRVGVVAGADGAERRVCETGTVVGAAGEGVNTRL